MDLKRSTPATDAKPAQSIPQPETRIRGGVQNDIRNNLRNAVRNNADAAHKSSGFGLPCANCRLYYPANLDACPGCNSKERVSPSIVPALLKAQSAAGGLPANIIVEQERKASPKELDSQLLAAHAEVEGPPLVCTFGERHVQGAEAASICKPCYDRLQERLDVCEAALHMDLKEAAQIIYAAVWADPSEPGKTYTNAASALLIELRKRSGFSGLRGPFRPLPH